MKALVVSSGDVTPLRPMVLMMALRTSDEFWKIVEIQGDVEVVAETRTS